MSKSNKIYHYLNSKGFAFNGVWYAPYHTNIQHLDKTDIVSLLFVPKNTDYEIVARMVTHKKGLEYLMEYARNPGAGGSFFYAQLDIPLTEYIGPYQTLDDKEFIFAIDGEGYCTDGYAASFIWDTEDKCDCVKWYSNLSQYKLENVTHQQAKALPIHSIVLSSSNQYFSCRSVAYLFENQFPDEYERTEQYTVFVPPTAPVEIAKIINGDIITLDDMRATMRRIDIIKGLRRVEDQIPALLERGYIKHPSKDIYIAKSAYRQYRTKELVIEFDAIKEQYGHCTNLQELVNAIGFADSPASVFALMANHITLGDNFETTTINW